MNQGHLFQYFLNNSDKLLYKWLHYFEIYERHFQRFRNKRPVMLEIGVLGGGSLAMWRDYFGHDCQIIGIDINPECKKYEAEGIEIFIGSQDDPALIHQILEKYPQIDIVLDDGSHIMHHMIATFELLYHKVSPKGCYMVEDAHSSYWPEFGGGVCREDSFMEFVKSKMDEINAVHTRGVLPVSSFTQSTDYIACYDSIVVFERRPQGQRQAIITQGMQLQALSDSVTTIR